MRVRTRNPFSTVTTEGAILPIDLLQRIAELDQELDGLQPEDYHLAPNERLREAISRSWNRLLGIWKNFKDEIDGYENAERPLTTETREKWSLHLFQELGFGRLPTTKAIEVDHRRYPVSHRWEQVPIHLLAFNVDLDKRTRGVAGAAQSSPHSMVQECLNRTEEYLWAFLCNGLKLRILRDNASLVRQAYVEFDLESMMEQEAFSDFVLLWLVCHESRVEGEQPEQYWLERWSHSADEQGTRALDALREGVEQAINELGTGFIDHQNNEKLRSDLESGTLTRQGFYRQLLRLAYRLIFLFTAEDRNLLLLPDTSETVRKRYDQYYSVMRLRNLAEHRRGDRHNDLYECLKLVMSSLAASGQPRLGLPALGSFLWKPEAISDLHEATIENQYVLEAIRSLSLVEQDVRFRPVDFKNLGPEELGGIYESLLELHPKLNLNSRSFTLTAVSGSERKTTGSYYTPESLIQSLLNTALNPLLDEAERSHKPEQTILNLKVCDPACGSGHFLIAAAHRMANRLAAVRSGDAEPAPGEVRHALRDIIGRCVYGVDMNPMAVELCKVNLWLEALEPGKPLSFLDHHIQCGNSLIGATPKVLKEGIPDDAFKQITGDVKAVAAEYKKRNKLFRHKRQHDLFGQTVEPWKKLGNLPELIASLETLPDDQLSDIERKSKLYYQYLKSSDYRSTWLMADTWCAAFVWEKSSNQDLWPLTEEDLRNIEKNPFDINHRRLSEIQRLAKQYRFFHWHLAFPEVFYLPKYGEDPENIQQGWNGGFDLMIGNPPWEHTELKEKEFFAVRRPDIAEALNKAKREKLINKLKNDDQILYQEYINAKREVDAISHIGHNSTLYPLCGRKRINLYQLFAEQFRNLSSHKGRVGVVLPTGIATDDTTKYFFQNLVENKSLVSLYDFENRNGLFPGVHRSYKFCLLTLTGSKRPNKKEVDFIFFNLEPEDLHDDHRHFTLTPEEIALINPNTKTCPIFRSKRDAEITKAIYLRFPVLINENKKNGNPWGIIFKQGLFNMSSDSHFFKTLKALEENGYYLKGNFYLNGKKKYVPLYEQNLIHQYNHRFASFRKDDGTITSDQSQYIDVKRLKDYKELAIPRYWVEKEIIEEKKKSKKLNKNYYLSFRRSVRSTDSRSLIFSLLPDYGVGDSIFLISTDKIIDYDLTLLSIFNSFVTDYFFRLAVSGENASFYFIKQLPIPIIDQIQDLTFIETPIKWIVDRVKILVLNSLDTKTIIDELYLWDEEKREIIKNELDAAFFHLYAIERDDVDYIMETFPIVKRKDEKQYGEYRTKRLILEIYDEMQQAIETGVPYESKVPLDEEETIQPATVHPIVPEEKKEPKEPTPFDEAILISALVREISSEEFPMGNFRIQKFTYLVHRAEQSNVLRSYYKHAAGPYNPSLKYQGPVKIALDNGYIQEHEYQKRKGFITGLEISNIDKYLPKRSFTDVLDWVVETFKYVKSAKLELLTTVDYAILELTEQGTDITVDSIKKFIASDEEWAPKLKRKIFSDWNIEKAIGELREWFRYE